MRVFTTLPTHYLNLEKWSGGFFNDIFICHFGSFADNASLRNRYGQRRYMVKLTDNGQRRYYRVKVTDMVSVVDIWLS